MSGTEQRASSIGRRSLLIGAVAATAACTADAPTDSGGADAPPVRLTSGVTTVVPGRELHGALRSVSRAFFEAAEVVVVAGDSAQWGAAAETAMRLGVPVLLADTGLDAELTRLGAKEVVSYAGPDLRAGSRRTVPGAGTVRPDVQTSLPEPPSAGRAVLVGERGHEIPALLRASATAAGAVVLEATGGDPRADQAVVAALRSRPEATVVGVGALGPAERFAARVHTARTAPEIPGGGILALPANRFVGIYGNPTTPSLGLLGEQDAAGAAARVGALAEEYAALVHTPVRPAFELIATVASSEPGSDGSYSSRTDPAVLAEWIDLAEAKGIYCLLDLQPGRSDFLTQAKAYAALLRRPGVGLALDPEWRLQPGELPLTRIGHVEAAEINAVAAWLAELVREANLPPKLLVLHQFQLQMLRDRDRIKLDHDELQVVVHVDGSGAPSLKQSTWHAVRQGLPKGVFLGWKNFIDEDEPMLTPEQTVAEVDPLPSLITYQ